MTIDIDDDDDGGGGGDDDDDEEEEDEDEEEEDEEENRSEDRKAYFARACAANVHFVWNFAGKMPDPNPGDIVLCEPSQEPFCVVIYRENAGRSGYHLDQTPGLNTYRKNPFSVATLFGEKTRVWTKETNNIVYSSTLGLLFLEICWIEPPPNISVRISDSVYMFPSELTTMICVRTERFCTSSRWIA